MRRGFNFEWVLAAARKAAVGIGAAGAVGTAAAIVFWDVDFYAVRDKWEHFRIAMFGDWKHADQRSVAGKPSAPKAEGMFTHVKGINFFAEVPSKEHGVVVITGVVFETVKDFEQAKQRNRWCYLMVAPKGALPRRIDLGAQAGMAPPVYADISVYPAEELAAIGLSARTLQALAKTHCRFAKATVPPRFKKGEGRT